jgi:polysaccharide biosynthesis/export protein
MRLIIALLAGLVLAGPVLAQEGYRIHPGDVLRVEVIEDPSLNRSALVSPDGRITVPLAGAVAAAGRPVDAVQADLARLLAPNFAAPPSVYVSIEKLAEPRAPSGSAPAAAPVTNIFVLGEVNHAGKHAIAPGTTVLQFFAEMGGFSKFAATKRIQLRRVDASGVEKVYLINYDAVEKGSSKAGGTVLREGDVILVPQRHLFE